MKKVLMLGCVLALASFVPAARAQDAGTTAARQKQDAATTTGAQPQVVRDPEQEKESLHNLTVARHYFKLKKAYRAALARCEEIMAGDPNYSRLDEVLYIAGMSSLRLSENRGKQASNAPPETLRDDAREYFTRLVNQYPQSEFRKEAEEKLQTLGKKTSSQ